MGFFTGAGKQLSRRRDTASPSAGRTYIIFFESWVGMNVTFSRRWETAFLAPGHSLSRCRENLSGTSPRKLIPKPFRNLYWRLAPEPFRNLAPEPFPKAALEPRSATYLAPEPCSGTSLRNLAPKPPEPRSGTSPESAPEPLRNLAPEPCSGTSATSLQNLSRTSPRNLPKPRWNLAPEPPNLAPEPRSRTSRSRIFPEPLRNHFGVKVPRKFRERGSGGCGARFRSKVAEQGSGARFRSKVPDPERFRSEVPERFRYNLSEPSEPCQNLAPEPFRNLAPEPLRNLAPEPLQT